jgi:GNAT superfamily N-acetyltransferase
MTIDIRPTLSGDVPAVEEMLVEAARWVDALGVVMWEQGELDHREIEAEVSSGQFLIAEVGSEPAGAVRFQLEDRLFWPDIAQNDSAFVHRLVVRRRFKAQGVSQALLEAAVERARASGRRYLRLDCDADRTKLRALYEQCGFRLHSFRQVTSYYVARYQYPIDVGAGSG